MKTNYFFFVLFVSLFLSACLKNENELHTGEYPDIASFLQTKKPVQQFFTIDANAESEISGSKGTHLIFYPNSLMHADGSIVTGQINITLIEVYTNADMIYSGIYPVSNGNVLNSGGECFISASQNGEELQITPGSYCSIKIPAQIYDADMGFYAGGSLATTANWNYFAPVPYDSVAYADFMDYNELDNTYNILADTLGWVNCDAFKGDPVVNCKVHLTGIADFNPSNTVAFLILDDLNSVVACNPPFINTLNLNDVGNVDMHLLVISVNFGYLYYGILPIHPEEGGYYELTVTTTTEAALDAAILAIP